MAEPPQDATLLTQIGVGVTTILGWFWYLITGNSKKYDMLRDALSDHEKHVAENYPTKPEMEKALDKTVAPIHKKLDENAQLSKDILKQLNHEKDDEIKRLREELAKHSRRD